MRAPTRTIFLGSGRFAVPILETLADLDGVDVVAVVTAPPRPAGRRRQLTVSPVGALSTGLGIPVMAPESLRDRDTIAAVAACHPDLVVLADYGRLVPRAILDLPRHRALNLHPSLLPRHRGATPVEATILAGDPMSGVTLMRMDQGMDTGPIVAQREWPLTGHETAPELEACLAGVAASLLHDSLPDWIGGRLDETPQPIAGATFTRPLKREDGRLDPFTDAVALERHVRALQPWPGAWVDTAQGRIAVLEAGVLPSAPGSAPGLLVEGPDGATAMTTVAGLLLLRRVRPAGGREMSSQELLRGRPTLVGTSVLAPSSASSPAPR